HSAMRVPHPAGIKPHICVCVGVLNPMCVCGGVLIPICGCVGSSKLTSVGVGGWVLWVCLSLYLCVCWYILHVLNPISVWVLVY
ncbi:hypothetical protein B484DRAFT_322681, partial [Ochromonadaceae sp. CCMP2298]